jgi:ribose transport system substrate-binding protein
MVLVTGAVMAALSLAACGSASDSGGGAVGSAASAKTLDPKSLGPDEIVGQGPNGEPAASPEEVALTPEEAAKAKAERFEVGIIVQQASLDWAKLQVRGITDTLKEYGATVIGVTDPDFQVDRQIAGIENMIQRKPDAIISIPVDDTATAPAYKKISEAGIKLVLMDNVPKGLKHPADYASMVSADSQGNGMIAAEVIANEIPEGGTVGIIGFGVDFFVTDEREVGVKNWLKENRPDIKIKQADFLDTTQAGSITGNFLTANPDVKGLFVIWDAIAMQAVSAARGQGVNVPMTTIDLGLEASIEIAQGGMIKGLGAQQPYEQGRAEALVALKALLGQETPAWIGVRSLPVIQSNILDAYKTVWKTDPPEQLVTACNASKGCGG